LGKSGDNTSDLYSVGVLLYELLSGRLPFTHESGDLVAMMFSHVNDRPRPPRQLNPLIPPSLDRIIMRLLDKDPARRYVDAAALIADLRSVQAQLARGSAKQDKAKSHEAPEPDADEELATAHTPVAPASGPAAPADADLPVEPPSGGYLKGELVTSKTFTAALKRVMQGMISARAQNWSEAEEHYSAAVGMLKPLNQTSELARTYARLGALYVAKIRSSGNQLPSDVATAREYLSKALPTLRDKRMVADVKEVEANLRALDAV
jgi:serine/threonine protein kinase